MIGLDIAKSVSQAHGADESGEVVFRKKITRLKLHEFFASVPPCVVAMEACGGAHHWAREIGKFGHEVRLIAPKYVKPFVKRQKNDAADAEAICEAATRPTMRFVSPKSEAMQARGLVFRTRDILVRQRTQITNAVRGHLAECGLVVPQGAGHCKKLVGQLEDSSSRLPEAVRSILWLLTRTATEPDDKISQLDKDIARRTREDDVARRLMTIPGVGPITATAIAALAPPATAFRKGRDFAAGVGLTPLQKRLAANRNLARRRRWVNELFAGSSSRAPPRRSITRRDEAWLLPHGGGPCLRESRACW